MAVEVVQQGTCVLVHARLQAPQLVVDLVDSLRVDAMSVNGMDHEVVEVPHSAERARKSAQAVGVAGAQLLTTPSTQLPGLAGAGLGGGGQQTAPAGRWRSGCWPTASTSWTCRQAVGEGAVVRHGHNRKTDPHDAHAVAVVAARTTGLRVLAYDEQLEALRMLVDRREELTRHRVQTINRLQRLLSELTPGKAKKDLTALQAKRILASARPRDLACKTRKRLALEQEKAYKSRP